MYRLSAVAFLLLLSGNSTALMLKGYYANIPSNQSETVITVSNPEAITTVISAKAVEIDSPVTQKPLATAKSSDLLFTPAKQIIRKKSDGKFRFIFNGQRQNKERYFKIIFTETYLNESQTSGDKKSAGGQLAISLPQILIVAPKPVNQQYLLNHNGLSNTGNVTLLVRANGRCKDKTTGKSTSCNVNYPAMPGQQLSFAQFDPKQMIPGTIEGDREEMFTLQPLE
jgi:hypothetical protein